MCLDEHIRKLQTHNAGPYDILRAREMLYAVERNFAIMATDYLRGDCDSDSDFECGSEYDYTTALMAAMVARSRGVSASTQYDARFSRFSDCLLAWPRRLALLLSKANCMISHGSGSDR